MATAHYERGEVEECHAWALIAAGMSVPQGFLILAQLAEVNDPAAAADWALRGLALPAPDDDPEPLIDLEEEEEFGESELHLLAAVSLAKLGRIQESRMHLVAAAGGGNQRAQSIVDAMLKQNGQSSNE